MVAGLCVAPVVFFLFAGLPKQVQLGATGVAVLVGLACFSPHWRQYGALLAALVYPMAAFVAIDAKRSWIVNFATVIGLSVIGGATVAGLLSALPYYIRAAEFPGVKVAVFLPIVLVGVIYFARLGDMRKAWNEGITWGSLLFGLALIGAFAFMLARTGNDNPAAVSSTELKIRDVLDHILLVRPRTKAFLIGFPALLVGFRLLAGYEQNRKRWTTYGAWTALVITVGAISSTDIVNTLCHIHTPVVLSLTRIAIELLLGIVIGLGFWRLIEVYLLSGKHIFKFEHGQPETPSKSDAENS